MTNEIDKNTRYSQDYIDKTLEVFFEKYSHVDINRDSPTPAQIADIIRDILNDYTNGDTKTSQSAFRYLTQCYIENFRLLDQNRDIMLILRQVNTDYKELLNKSIEMAKSFNELQLEHETLMEAYLS